MPVDMAARAPLTITCSGLQFVRDDFPAVCKVFISSGAIDYAGRPRVFANVSIAIVNVNAAIRRSARMSYMCHLTSRELESLLMWNYHTRHELLSLLCGTSTGQNLIAAVTEDLWSFSQSKPELQYRCR